MIHEATRTLVKSHPEVWEQCSDPESLSRHLNGSFGEIRITRLEPESTVAWEGEHGSGTVTIEPSAWGTRVTLTAHTKQDEGQEAEEPVPAAEAEPAVQLAPAAAEAEPAVVAPWEVSPRESLIQRLMHLWRGRSVADQMSAAPALLAASAQPVAPPEPEPEATVAGPEPEPVPPETGQEPEPGQDGSDGSVILMAALESMGQAHHRPYSRG